MAGIESTAEKLKASHAGGAGAVEVASIAREELGPGFGAMAFIACFRLAFAVPLPVLQRAQAWEGFGWGDRHISDEEFTALLAPWLAAPNRPAD
ncbi:hypothetical protein OHT52_21840 [Streptomyces sp. NBC_00247]|uniref:hypothetical protein n=1 Tax=Streptomyces sp. NBC_00247 TaxID=2975689 RepID=UPI002E2E44FE|nr:hypothetical protein [Streptomyces sp. NBC_00247]